MKKNLLGIYCLLILWTVVVVAETYAHGGGHSKPKAEDVILEDATSAEDTGSFYSVDSEEADSPSSPFSRTDLFSDGMEHDGMKMQLDVPEHEEMKHDQHQVKLSRHELVSPSQKGYKVAVGITVLAGLFFAVLGAKRKKEG